MVVERIAIVMSTVCNANSPRPSVSLHAGLKIKRRGEEEEEEEEEKLSGSLSSSCSLLNVFCNDVGCRLCRSDVDVVDWPSGISSLLSSPEPWWHAGG